MPSRILIAIITLMVITSASSARVAAAQGASLPSEITSGEWALVSLQSAPGTVQDTVGKGITILFDPNGTASGSGGCNRFSGGYTVGSGQQLTFGELLSTLIGCEEAIATREAEYLAALRGVSTYALDGAGQLQLTFGNGQGLLTYTKGQPTSLPQTGGNSDTMALLGFAGLLCCMVGVWVLRRRVVA
ncbi:MAG: META domain-containing protein [Roseiflexaceae bacterium]|nr:META domain-containing protein [Roseiflexaceae bacterium]